GTPILVPTFLKCRGNLQEMEDWYDRWLRAAGMAVLIGPSDYAGQIPDQAAADMSPPRRCACRRLASRLTILSDGQVVSCEQDVLGKQVLGQLGSQTVREIYQEHLAGLRKDHWAGKWDAHPLCRSCREWDRP
ncbi:MAG: SPASM domain-containing protein, partial [Bacillota bacterium]